MERKAIRLKIWGCKGSHTTAGFEYIRYGGNTPCIEILTEPGEEKIILDAGSGLGFLGLTMREEKNIKANIFLSHTHPDHKEDLPHFFPLYVPGNKIRIWTSWGYAKNFEKARDKKLDLDYIMNYPSYPMAPIEFPSVPQFSIMQGIVEKISDYLVEAFEVKHFEGATAYRIVRNRKSIVYAPDVSDISTNEEETVNFCAGSELIIWDSLYRDTEINDATKMRHSSIESVIQLAHKASVPRVIHFHHSPLRTDRELEALEKMSQIKAKQLTGGLVQTEFARDGMIIEI